MNQISNSNFELSSFCFYLASNTLLCLERTLIKWNVCSSFETDISSAVACKAWPMEQQVRQRHWYDLRGKGEGAHLLAEHRWTSTALHPTATGTHRRGDGHCNRQTKEQGKSSSKDRHYNFFLIDKPSSMETESLWCLRRYQSTPRDRPVLSWSVSLPFMLSHMSHSVGKLGFFKQMQPETN